MLTDQLIINSNTEDIFFDLFAAVQYAERLNQHVNRIKEAILSLVRTNKIGPNLIKWASVHNTIAKLREKAKIKEQNCFLDLHRTNSNFIQIGCVYRHVD